MNNGRVSSLQFATSQMLSMQLQQWKLCKSIDQISSGKKYATPADNPNDANRLFRIQQQKASLENYKEVSKIANSYLEQADSVLTSLSTTLLSARETVTALNSGTLTANDANTLAYKLETLLSQLVDQANTNINGRYLFSGSKDSRPISQDVNGNYVYKGDQEYQKGIVADNVLIQMNDTAEDVFFHIPTSDVKLAGFAGRAAVTASNPGLCNPGQLTTAHSLTLNELNINGLDIAAAVASSDTLSSSDNIASALAITRAINKNNNATNVTAYYSDNILTFNGGGAYVDHNFVAGEFKINGVDIVGDTTLLQGATVVDRLSSLVNSTFPNKEIVASNSGGQLCLTAIDGRNLQIESSGLNPAGLDLIGFDFALGDNKVQRADISLKSDQAIDIATNTFVTNANAIGFSPGVANVINNTGTAVMSAPIMRDTVMTASPQERYFISFASATTYNVYRESDPFNPVVDFKVYNSSQNGQTYEKDATKIATVPATYTPGDSIIIDGVEVTLTGVPAAGDVFTIDKGPQASNDIFSALKATIYAAKNYHGQNTRYAYNMNIALKNIIEAGDRVADVHGMVGARQQRIEFEMHANDRLGDLAAENMSSIMDVDIAEAATRFTQSKTALEATQKMMSITSQLSLFNFMR